MADRVTRWHVALTDADVQRAEDALAAWMARRAVADSKGYRLRDHMKLLRKRFGGAVIEHVIDDLEAVYNTPEKQKGFILLLEYFGRSIPNRTNERLPVMEE